MSQRHSTTLPLFAILVASIAATASSQIVTYTDKTTFFADMGAVATDALPDTFGSVTTITVGDLTVTTPSPNFDSDPLFSNRLTGNVISVTAVEDLDIDSASTLFSFGFDFHEPELDPNLNGTFEDSTFSLTLRHLGTLVSTFDFNAPNDTAAFVGVGSTSPFDSIEIRETTGGSENEFFGQFYTGTTPVPEPASHCTFVIAACLIAMRRRSARRNKQMHPSREIGICGN